jgi:predicted ester cyclase
MTLEANKQLALRFFEEALNGGKLELLDEIMAADYVEHGAPPDRPPGREGFKAFLGMVAGAFPDLHVHVEDMLAEGSRVAVRLTVHGTHKGVLMGDIQPTGKQAKWTGIDILEVEGGKIAGRWSQRDLLGLMQQLGVQ